MNAAPQTTHRRRCAAALLLALAGAAGAQELVIGQTLPLTGTSNSTIAEELRRGRQACVDQVNAQGGIRGHRLRLVTRDDQGDAGRAVAMARELAEREGAVAMLGTMGPAVNIAQLEWARTAGMPVVGPQGGDIEVRLRDSVTSFFITANQGAEAERLASHIASLGIKNVAIVHGTDRAGIAARTALEEALGLSHANIVAFVPVAADGHNAAKAAGTVQRTKAQAVLLATSGGVTTAMLRAFGTGAPEGSGVLQTYGMSSAASQSALQDVGEGARGFSMSQVVPFPRDLRLPVVSTFQAAMRGVSGDRSHAELEGCLGPLLLAEVLRRKPVEPSRSGVLQALKTAGRVSIGGFEVDLSDRARPGSRFTDIVYVGANGKMYR